MIQQYSSFEHHQVGAGTLCMAFHSGRFQESLRENAGVSAGVFLTLERSGTMTAVKPITPCLWFDTQAEEAARYYTGIFKNSKIGKISRYTEAGREVHRQKAGTVMTVEFELNGQPFTALNGGPVFKFNEAISFQIMCQTQEEVDHYWNKLSEGGDKNAQQCGWVKDKYGLSWQVVPTVLPELMSSPDKEKAGRAMEAMLQMKKLDIAELKRAFEGETATSRR
jgi:predicted 3-demethylubiquinone-9 3-methyltransferase (glyoxalase superfamily)